MTYSKFSKGIDLTKPIPQELCHHVLVERSNVSSGGKCPNECIKCKYVVWLPRKSRRSMFA